MDQKINITVYLPYLDVRKGTSWGGVLQFVEVSNSIGAGGAVVNSGLAKIVTVTAGTPVFPFYYIIIAVAAVCVAVAVSVLVLWHRMKKPARKPSKKAAAVSRGRKAAARGKARRAGKKARPAARRRATRARRGARTSARRRTRR
jgi:NADH:ubiquinone oxidoreductase subunit K